MYACKSNMHRRTNRSVELYGKRLYRVQNIYNQPRTEYRDWIDEQTEARPKQWLKEKESCKQNALPIFGDEGRNRRKMQFIWKWYVTLQLDLYRFISIK